MKPLTTPKQAEMWERERKERLQRELRKEERDHMERRDRLYRDIHRDTYNYQIKILKEVS